MKKSCKFCWALSVLLFVTVLGMGYVFLLRGNVTASNDDRTAVVLTPGERDMILGEMRDFLEAVQTITGALAEDDMATVIETARAHGMAATGGVPTTLMGKLPLELKTLGFDTHKLFDGLADTAQKTKDPKAVLSGLGDLMLNCTACHASYKIVTPKMIN